MLRSKGHGYKSFSYGLESLTSGEKFSGGGGGEWWWWQTKFSVSPGPGLWSLVLGPFGPDLGPGPGLELDNIKIRSNVQMTSMQSKFLLSLTLRVVYFLGEFGGLNSLCLPILSVMMIG